MLVLDGVHLLHQHLLLFVQFPELICHGMIVKERLTDLKNYVTLGPGGTQDFYFLNLDERCCYR